MPHRRLARLGALAALVALTASSSPAPAGQRPERHAAFTGPAPRAPRVLTERSLARLRAEGRSVLWVFFTDKGIPDAASFARAVGDAGRRASDRARARRARESGGAFVPDYYDVPVVPAYVEGVTRTGARVRNVSRWLNAVSIEADAREAAAVAALEFVRVVTPALRSRRVEPVAIGAAPPGGRAPWEEGAAPAEGTPQGERATALDPPNGNYGSSLTQLSSINVPAAHDSGWSGAGVIVGMFDTGFNKSHRTTAPLKRIAEWDYVFGDGETENEPADNPSQWNHGTGTWSVLGGYYPGSLVGPAFNASFFLAKTEDIRTETPVEEDNWLAAMERSDSLGVDVVSSSLAYLDFDAPNPDYTYADLDGYTAIVSQAAIFAARRGIVVANSMGNSGPNAGTLWAPADAESILSVGAVDSGNSIASFSSRGPTFDGRIKPEVVAQGVNTIWAVAGDNTQETTANGTSLSTPLVGGAAALVREAHPEWTAQQVREALMETADRAGNPGNAYGWGRIDVIDAIYNSSHGGLVAPSPFDLRVPAHGTVIAQGPVQFRWRRAADPTPGDIVTYTFYLGTASPDSCVFMTTITDTSVIYSGYLGPSRAYRWSVVAADLLGHERESRDAFQFTTTPTTDVPVSGLPPVTPEVVLFQNRPNPVRGSTRIEFTLSGPTGYAPARLQIFDAQGRLVRTLFDGIEAVPRECTVSWDGTDASGRRAASGIYYYRLDVGGNVLSRRLAHVR